MDNLQILFIGLFACCALYIITDRICTCIENIRNTKNLSKAFSDWIEAGGENPEVLLKSNGMLHKSNEIDKTLL